MRLFKRRQRAALVPGGRVHVIDYSGISLPIFVHYNTATRTYSARPHTDSQVWWTGPVPPADEKCREGDGFYDGDRSYIRLGGHWDPAIDAT